MKIGKKLKGLIGNVAPILGTALGGPLGGVAGKFVADALGVDTEAAALAAIELDPNNLLKIKEAEIAFDQRMRELDIDLEKVHADDRGSARKLATNTSIVPQLVLGGFYTVAYIGTLVLFITGNVNVDPEYKDMVIGLLGTLAAVQVQILNFFFGSSSGSKNKSATIAKNGHAT